MKVIVYNGYWKLYNCKNLIGFYKKNYNRCILFIKNGKAHNETSYAYISISSSAKQFAYKDIYYQDITNNKSWRKFIKPIIREEKLKVFL